MEKKPKAVVCPVFNEPGTWANVCRELTSHFDLVVVVDDGSQIPLEIDAGKGITLLRHPENLGKGRALETGFEYCLEFGAEIIGTIDADSEHDPANFAPALKAMGTAGIISVSRAPIYGSYSLARRLRNEMISRQLSKELSIALSDTQSGMRLMSAEAVRAFLRAGIPPGYAVETQALRAAHAAGLELREVPLVFPGTPRPEKRLYNPYALWSDLRILTMAIIGNRHAPVPIPRDLEASVTKQTVQ